MKTFRIALSEVDLGQIIDGLEVRVDAWESAAEYHRTGKPPSGVVVEQCDNAEEAAANAVHYRSIIAAIMRQREEQS